MKDTLQIVPSVSFVEEHLRMNNAEISLNRTHMLLAVQSLVVVLVSINRLGPFSLEFVAPNEFLRWVDFNNMLPLPMLSILAFYLLMQQMRSGEGGRAAKAAGLAFIAGVYLLGASYGNHEVTNYLHGRFCSEGVTSDWCRIVIFNDDEFSHWVFFAGFSVVNIALMAWQAIYPRARRLAKKDGIILAMNGAFIGVGIFANLALEQTGLDLYLVALLACLAVGLFWRRGAQPLFVYYSTAYCLGLGATGLYKLMG